MAIKIDVGKRDGFPFKEGKYKNSKVTIDVGIKTRRNPNIKFIDGIKPNIYDDVKKQTGFNYQTAVPKKVKKEVNIDKSKGIKLRSGQKISLTQKIPNLSKLLVALEWNLKNTTQYPLELDTSIFMVNLNNKTEEKDFIFYNNLKSRCGGVVLKADHSTGLLEGFDEMVQLDLNKIPSHIQKLAFTVTIDQADERNQNFNLVSDGYFKVIDGENKTEILTYRFDEQLSIETAIVVAEIYRYKDEWKINAVGRGFKGGLKALCDNYGIETE
ncbi:tellurium resistance protein TerD [Caminicella sporogenes DSM 14501]|uniref:Tellurium resistance protein TerD n=1 Tax=Caminicella sporogenes DSM 14501 TaxID=1121266 RepID=A0A1M6QKM8_9FIRM|nr:TerD family protein [Caminicella sporogenes]SHK20802.1 tellurium resistance protein TerD [Caminicella sporogenes DSM 14501]